MKLIAHRGNIQGAKRWFENKPEYVDIALQLGYDVEVDVFYEKGDFWLGHDAPRYRVNEAYLTLPGIWCHAKSMEALERMLNNPEIHCFWHEEDQFTLTSRNLIWTADESSANENSVLVSLDETTDKFTKLYGICSDNVKFIKEAITGIKQREFNMNDARDLNDIIPDDFFLE